MSTAARFCFKFCTCTQHLFARDAVLGALTAIFVVPGIGMISSPCASSQAREIWPAVALYFLPRAASPSHSFKMFGKFSAE